MALEEIIQGKVVLITGAAGSIGQLLAERVAALEPARLLILDRAETPLFWVHQRLRRAHPDLALRPLLIDLTDAFAVEELLGESRPDVILHAAAYKHVPLLEEHPRQALLNNFKATLTLARWANRFEVSRTVLVSTDKAVRPTSVMGVTKRAAECVMISENVRASGVRLCSVRFGNVLGSSGSVVPLFRQQIESGGPITITHPKMRRYFISADDACDAILHAARLTDRGGEVFIWRSGEPQSIEAVAEEMIATHAEDPGEIDIEYVGPRPGEKLVEELVLHPEDLVETEHPNLSMARGDMFLPEGFMRTMEDVLHKLDSELSVDWEPFLKRLDPYYEPAHERRDG